jgi:hypothetical protein
VVVPLALTHEALGRLIGARRPTVTLALKALGAQERLLRRGDGAWLLADGDLTTLPHRELSPLAGPARPRLVGLGRPTADGAAPPPLPSVPDEGVLVDELERLRGRHESLRDRVSELAERTARNRAVTQSLIRPSD